MKTSGFSYVVLRYTHDAVTEETLNWGVVLFAPGRRYLGWRTDAQGTRLSHAFRGFSRATHRSVRRWLDQSLSSVQREFHGGQLSLFDPPTDAAALMARLWPDVGTQYRHGPAQSILPGESFKGIGEPETILDQLYEMYVSGQAVQALNQTRGDRKVWRPLGNVLRERGLLDLWGPQSFQVAEFEFAFDHAHRNGELHVVEALSFDLSNAEEIRDKTARWLGYGRMLRDYDCLGQFVLFLGPPADQRLLSPFHAAEQQLRQMPIKPSVYTEGDSDRCADELARLVAAR